MKSTPILGSALLEEISLSGFKSQAWSFGNGLTKNDWVKGLLSLGSAHIFPMDSGLPVQSQWIRKCLVVMLASIPEIQPSPLENSVSLATGFGAEVWQNSEYWP